MRKINPKWILAAALLWAAPLWAAERNGELLPYTASSPAQARQIKKEQDDALKSLIAGNKRFMRHGPRHTGNPTVMIVSCADAHVPPETIFGVKPGTLYTNRAFGNIVDKVILASLEYGAEHLGCKVLVVMGHTGCTALETAIEEHDHPRPDDQWRSLNQKALYEELEPAVAEVEQVQKEDEARTGKSLKGEALLNAVVKANVLSTMHAIREQSPLLWDLEQKDFLKIVGCIYNKDTGKVDWIKE
jgi:carbonic anhydrase